jgi:hypothetical protein
MKKVTKKLALLMVVLTTGFANAQDATSDDRDQMRFGFKAGVNFANVYDEEGEDFVAEGKTGLAAGVFLSVPFGKLFGFQPELMYSQKGFKSTGSVLGANYDFKRTSTFLDIPLLVQVKPIKYVTILAGPQFSYLLETKNEFNGYTASQEEEINSADYKKNIFGFVIGTDINIEQFVISGRVAWDINKSDADGNTTSPRYKNQVVQLALGYRF